MQVWNVVHGSLETQDPKIAKNSPSRHHRTTLSGYVFATKACINNRKKVIKQQYISPTSSQYGGLWPTNGWDPFGSLEHPSKFQRLSRFAALLHGTLVSVSQSLRRWTEGGTYIRQGGHHVGHWPTFWLMLYCSLVSLYIVVPCILSIFSLSSIFLCSFSNKNTMVVPRTRTSFSDRRFAAAGPCLWNTSPVNLRQMNNNGQFRWQLKVFRA